MTIIFTFHLFFIIAEVFFLTFALTLNKKTLNMKKLLSLFILSIVFISCENESDSVELDSSTELDSGLELEPVLEDEEVDLTQLQQSFIDELEGVDGVDDLDLEILELENEDAGFSNSRYNHSRPRLTSLCLVKDADRDPFGDSQPTSNMWWPENDTDFFESTAYFSSTRYRRLIFATFSDGTALIRGITTMNDGHCKVFVNVWLKDKLNLEDFTAIGGEFKLEPGTASQAAIPSELVYYDIDASRSILCAWGGDCLEEGSFGLELRGGPEGEFYRAQLGLNGAAFDSNIGALGFSTWGFITDRHTGEQLWVMDFDFRLRCWLLDY